MKNIFIGIIIGIIVTTATCILLDLKEHADSIKVVVNEEYLDSMISNEIICSSEIQNVDSLKFAYITEIILLKNLFSKKEKFPNITFREIKYCKTKNIYKSYFILDSGIMGTSTFQFDSLDLLSRANFYNSFDTSINTKFEPTFYIKKCVDENDIIIYSSFHDTILVYKLNEN